MRTVSQPTRGSQPELPLDEAVEQLMEHDLPRVERRRVDQGVPAVAAQVTPPHSVGAFIPLSSRGRGPSGAG